MEPGFQKLEDQAATQHLIEGDGQTDEILKNKTNDECLDYDEEKEPCSCTDSETQYLEEAFVLVVHKMHN